MFFGEVEDKIFGVKMVEFIEGICEDKNEVNPEVEGEVEGKLVKDFRIRLENGKVPYLEVNNWEDLIIDFGFICDVVNDLVDIVFFGKVDVGVWINIVDLGIFDKVDFIWLIIEEGIVVIIWDWIIVVLVEGIVDFIEFIKL